VSKNEGHGDIETKRLSGRFPRTSGLDSNDGSFGCGVKGSAALGVTPAAQLAGIRSGKQVRIAGNVIVRQRPGTAKGIVFLSIEDETGIANAVVTPDIFDANRVVILSSRWLMVEGPIQNIDNVIHVRAKRIEPLGFSPA
jgi:DNA polymerase III alpha subunit